MTGLVHNALLSINGITQRQGQGQEVLKASTKVTPYKNYANKIQNKISSGH